jgi:drug/metabolite transporter, DME family
MLVLGGAVLWGTAGVAVTLGPDDARVWQIAAVRLGLGAVLLLAVAAATRAWSPPPRGGAGLVAGIALAVFQLGYFTAIDRTGVALGTVVAIGSSPLFAGLVDRLWSGARPERRWWPATGLGVVGLVLLLAPAGGEVTDVGGIAAGLLAGLAFATFAIASGRVMAAGTRRVASIGWLLAISSAVLVPLAVVLTVATGASAAWIATPPGLGAMGWLVVASTVVAYAVFGRGLAVVPASTATTLVLAEPLTAALLGIGVLRERPTVLEAAGGVLVLAALVVLSLPGSRPGGPRRGGAPSGRS